MTGPCHPEKRWEQNRKKGIDKVHVIVPQRHLKTVFRKHDCRDNLYKDQLILESELNTVCSAVVIWITGHGEKAKT